MKKVLSIILVAILCCVANSASAQGCAVSGTVTDASGEPLIGVSVLLKGTTNGTITDFNGKFSLNITCDKQVTLVFSYVGYVVLEVTLSVSSSGVLTIHEVKMSEDDIALE
jgi:iron complex outermembrane receptor protein